MNLLQHTSTSQTKHKLRVTQINVTESDDLFMMFIMSKGKFVKRFFFKRKERLIYRHVNIELGLNL